MTNVFASDMSTIAMESITPNMDDYWCHVDEYMESGNMDDLYCPLVYVLESIGRRADTIFLCSAIANDDVAGADCNCVKLSVGNNGIVDNNIHVVPVCECLKSIQFTMEEHLLICLDQACNDANGTPVSH